MTLDPGEHVIQLVADPEVMSQDRSGELARDFPLLSAQSVLNDRWPKIAGLSSPACCHAS